jgi:hypothetical protein
MPNIERYLGQFASEAEVAAFLIARRWYVEGQAPGTPWEGMSFFETLTGSYKVWDAATGTWNIVGGTGAVQSKRMQGLLFGQSLTINSLTKGTTTLINVTTPFPYTTAQAVRVGDEMSFDSILDGALAAAIGAVEPLTVLSVTGDDIELAWDSSAAPGTFVSGNAYVSKRILDIQNDYVVFGDTTLGDLTLELPLASTIPFDGYLWSFWANNMSNNQLIVQTTAPDVFNLGNDKVILDRSQSLHLGGNAMGWANIAQKEVTHSVRRVATWDAANFPAPAGNPVPFDNVEVDENDSVISSNLGVNPTRIDILTTGKHELAYEVSINSTAGGNWFVQSLLRINGVTTIARTDRLWGNFAFLPASINVAEKAIPLTAGDYIELVLIQTGLTGTTFFCDMTASRQI